MSLRPLSVEDKKKKSTIKVKASRSRSTGFRLDVSVFTGTLLSRPRPGPRSPKQRRVSKSRPSFAKQSGSSNQTSCLWSSRSLSLLFSCSFSFFFIHFFIFSFLHFIWNGQGQNPSPKRACLHVDKCRNLQTVPYSKFLFSLLSSCLNCVPGLLEFSVF